MGVLASGEVGIQIKLYEDGIQIILRYTPQLCSCSLDVCVETEML